MPPPRIASSHSRGLREGDCRKLVRAPLVRAPLESLGQPSQRGLDAPPRGGPERVLMVNYGGVLVSRITGSEGRVALILQVDEMLVVQGEPLPVVLGQFPLGVERGLP